LRRADRDFFRDLRAGRCGPQVASLPEAEKQMRKTVVLAVLAVIVVIIAVQFGPSLVSH
jgi:hypothetical protein